MCELFLSKRILKLWVWKGLKSIHEKEEWKGIRIQRWKNKKHIDKRGDKHVRTPPIWNQPLQAARLLLLCFGSCPQLPSIHVSPIMQLLPTSIIQLPQFYGDLYGLSGQYMLTSDEESATMWLSVLSRWILEIEITKTFWICIKRLLGDVKNFTAIKVDMVAS